MGYAKRALYRILTPLWGTAARLQRWGERVGDWFTMVGGRWAIAAVFALGVWISYDVPANAAGNGTEVIYPQHLSNSRLLDRDFSNQDLRASEFASSKLLRTDFHGANLRGAVFSRSAIIDTDLSGTNLTDAMLDQVDFQNVDLSDAILADTIFFRSEFHNVKIDGTDFTDALLDGAQARTLCQVATGVNSKTGIATRDSLGCS